MDLKKLIQKMTDIENGKKMLKESVVDECGGSMPMAPQTQGNPVTVSVNFNASGAENVMELLNLLKNSGLQDAAGPSEPSQGMRMDMEHFRNIVDAGHDDDGMDDEDDIDGIDAKFGMDDSGDGPMSKEEWSNSPDEFVEPDHNKMTKDLSGGINRQKDSFPRVSPGDNPMQKVKQEGVDKESLKSRLLQALEEKKAPKKKKPDADGDGVPDWADKKLGKDKKVKEATYLPDNPSERPTQLPNKKAYDIEKASDNAKKKDQVSLKKAPWDTDKKDSKVAEISDNMRGRYLDKALEPYRNKNQDTDTKSGEKDQQKLAKRSKYVGKTMNKLYGDPSGKPLPVKSQGKLSNRKLRLSSVKSKGMRPPSK